MNDHCAVMERYLPRQAHTIIFGSEDSPADKAQAASTAAKRRIPALGVYVVSTNKVNEAGIEYLFRDIPCRLFKLTLNDFFPPEMGVYETMGVDRVVNLKAAINFFGLPAMVIDGGTAMTYTAAGVDGNIFGGGILPGLQAKFRSMREFTGALPIIDAKEVREIIAARKTPFPTFASDTKGAMMGAVLTETALLLRNVIKDFHAQIQKTKATTATTTETTTTAAATTTTTTSNAPATADATANGSDTATSNANPSKKTTNTETNTSEENDPNLLKVFITGGDGDVIAKLLESGVENLLAIEPIDTLPYMSSVEFHKHKHLQHYGISALVMEKSKAFDTSNADNKDHQLREEIKGQRVAKKFYLRTTAGEKTSEQGSIFRGSIASITRGHTLEEDWFFIIYDDGDTEQMSFTEVYGKQCARALYIYFLNSL